MLTILKRYMPHILVAVALVSVTSLAYASVVLSANSQLHVTWNPNPVAIHLSSVNGQGSAVVQLTCSQNANGLVLTPKLDNSKVRLTVNPQNIPFCSSVPVAVTLFAVCKGYVTSCTTNIDQEISGQIDVTQPYNYYYYNGQNIPNSLAVKIMIPGPRPDFELSSNPTNITCTAGQSVTTTITLAPFNGFTGITKLSALVLPSGISVGVAPQNILGAGTATLTINCSTPGTYTVEVRGATNYETHSITIPVTISDTTLPSFVVTGELSTLQCAQGGTTTNAITVTAKNGFTGTVALSTEVALSGPTATVSPASLSTSGSATLTINCTTAGTYTVTVKSTSGDLSSTFIVPVTVTSPSTGDFAITADPTSLSNSADVTGTSTVKVTGASSFAGPIALSLSAPTGLTCQGITSSLTISTAGGDASTSLKCSSSTPGTYTASVTGTAAGKTHKVDVTFSVPATSLAATNPSGTDLWIPGLVIAAIAVAVVGSGLFLLRRSRR